MMDTSNIVVKQVAKKLELPEDLVKEVYDYYWKEGVKSAMRSGEHTAIRVAKLGTFVVSKRKLYRRISKYIAYIRHLTLQDTEAFKRSTKEQAIAKYRNDLRLLLDRRNELAILYNQTKTNSRNVKDSKLHKTDLD